MENEVCRVNCIGRREYARTRENDVVAGGRAWEAVCDMG